MSMNLHLFGKREITVNSTGEVCEQEIDFDLWQTPTAVTYDIFKKEDRLSAYAEWAASVDKRSSKVHIHTVKNWINESEKSGYSIFWDAW